MEQTNFIRDRSELRSQVQRVFAYDEFGLRRTIRNSFVLIPGDVENESVRREARVVLLFSLSCQINSGGAEYVLLQYMKCTPTIEK